MLARQAVLLTSSESVHPTQLLSRQQSTPVSPFSCNTYGPPRKCCKQKTYGRTKSFKCNTYRKQGGGGVMVNELISKKAPFNELPCFHAIAHSFPQWQLLRCFLFNSFRTLSVATGGAGWSSPISHSPLCKPSSPLCLGGIFSRHCSVLPTFNFQLPTFPQSPLTSPATISHAWLANASASISSPISTGAKKSPAPFASLRIPPCPSRRMTNTVGSKLAQDTAK